MSEPAYKSSRYNYFIEAEAGLSIGYNFLYRSFIRFPGEALERVTAFLDASTGEGAPAAEHEVPPQWREALASANFIVPGGFDELDLLKYRYRRSLFSDSALSLIVLPALWCNLDCPYCFEFKRNELMRPDVEDALLTWIERNFKSKRSVHVAWFGGEPLLAKPVIERLSERLQQFCVETRATYTSSLTTNGFYLDEQFQRSLRRLGIRNVQVTFDGDREQHDSLRRQRSGAGSFDTIFANVVSFCENVRDCQLSLRVNCCDANYDSVKSLMERFPATVKQRASVFFRWIWPNEASGFRDLAANRRGSAPFAGLADLYLEMSDRGWSTHNPHNSLSAGYCEVDYLDHYSVDPGGNVYLCTHTFDPSEAIGSVFAHEELVRPDAMQHYLKWYAANPFEDPECLACKLLPVCLGGCRLARSRGSRECIEERGDYALFVKNLLREQGFGRHVQRPDAAGMRSEDAANA